MIWISTFWSSSFSFQKSSINDISLGKCSGGRHALQEAATSTFSNTSFLVISLNYPSLLCTFKESEACVEDWDVPCRLKFLMLPVRLWRTKQLQRWGLTIFVVKLPFTDYDYDLWKPAATGSWYCTDMRMVSIFSSERDPERVKTPAPA